jgi:hypothetical protein
MAGKFLAGPFTATYNAKALGQSAQGFFLSHEFFKRLITGDAMAQTPQDAIYQGRAVFAEYDLIEAASAGIVDLIDPYASTIGTPLTVGPIGTLDVGWASSPSYAGRAKQLVLTAVAGSAAASGGPASITLPLSILAEGYPVRVLYGPDLRNVPIRQRIYPAADGVFGTVA